jgi:hypothetical protein
MSKGQFDETFRQSWFDDKRHKIDVRLKSLEVETDPNARKKLERSIARYRELITLGPEGASEASRKANEARRSDPGYTRRPR